MKNPVLLYFYDSVSALPFMFVSFKEDEASKEAWHIKKFHMPKADNQWKNNYLYMYLKQQQQRLSLRLSFSPAAVGFSPVLSY